MQSGVVCNAFEGANKRDLIADGVDEENEDYGDAERDSHQVLFQQLPHDARNPRVATILTASPGRNAQTGSKPSLDFAHAGLR
jgi:hypothetical protein